MNYRIAVLALVASLAAPAAAKVVSVVPHGFEVVETVKVTATPAQAYAALAQVGRWWNGEHSYSGDAANMRLEPRPGGCLCERMKDGGAIEHLRVVYAQPNRVLRLQGGLGPLQEEGAVGSLTWAIKPVAGGAELTQRYVVGGYARGGMEKLAPLVDDVLTEQLTRLKRFLDTGNAGAAKTR
jgi:uncharacterized protein YndB with AHSA1/START domain